MLSSLEEEATTREEQNWIGDQGSSEARRRKGFQKEEIMHCVKWCQKTGKTKTEK